jgi:hypothetical protein
MKYLVLLLVIIVKTSFSQPIKDYFYNNELSQIYNLSNELTFVTGIDERSIDFFSKITNDIYICLSKEESVLYLKEFKTGLTLDFINLNKIPKITLADNKYSYNEKTYSYKSAFFNLFGKFNQLNKTSFSLGLFEIEDSNSSIIINVDTINQKLHYDIHKLNDIIVKRKKTKLDTIFNNYLFKKFASKSLKCGQFDIINCSVAPYYFNKDIINTNCQLYFKSNLFHHSDFTTNAYITSLNDSTFLRLESSKYKIDIINKNLEVVKSILYDSLTKSIQKDFASLVVDFETEKLYLLTFNKYNQDSITYSIYAITNSMKANIHKVFTLTSNIAGYEFQIHNNNIYLTANNQFDKTKYIYMYKHKLSEEKLNQIRIFKKNKIKSIGKTGISNNNVLCYSDIYINHIIEKDKSDFYKLKTMPKEIQKKILRENNKKLNKSDSLKLFITKAIELIDEKQYDLLITKFFLFNDSNEVDKKILKSIDLEGRINEDIINGLISYMEIIKDFNLDFYMTNPINSNQRKTILNLTTKNGSLFQCCFKNNQWYFTTSYYSPL